MNKLRSASVIHPDPREDGFVRTSNVSRFLDSCSSSGIPPHDLFHQNDLNDSTPESLTRVARTIVALIHHEESPIADRSKYISGQGQVTNSSSAGATRSGLYIQAGSRAAASTPNLQVLHRSTSPVKPPSPTRRRYTPPTGLPTVRSNSPGENSSSAGNTVRDRDNHRQRALAILDNHKGENADPRVMTPPPRSPLRSRPHKRREAESADSTLDARASPETVPIAESRGNLVGGPVSTSPSDPAARQSVSSNMTESTAFSSLLDFRKSNANKFGTIRTVTTEATSDAPSFTRTEGSSVAASLVDDMKRRGTENTTTREVKLNDSAIVDLSKVAEEVEESSAKISSIPSVVTAKDNGKAREVAQQEGGKGRAGKIRAIHLGQGKWPDDFLDVFQSHSQSHPIPIPPKSPNAYQEDGSSTGALSIASSGSPRKLAIIDASRSNDSSESFHHLPRRPKHPARHSTDVPALLPKESILRRDPSPSAAPPGMLRRHSTKPSVHLQGHGRIDDPRLQGNGSILVPFPRSVSGEHGHKSVSPAPSTERSRRSDSPALSDNPRGPRGRFQSDIQGASSRRRARPISFDELGARPQRSRIESMANLGGASGHTSASDLLSRNSLDGSGIRRALIIREDGKPATHFVSLPSFIPLQNSLLRF